MNTRTCHVRTRVHSTSAPQRPSPSVVGYALFNISTFAGAVELRLHCCCPHGYGVLFIVCVVVVTSARVYVTVRSYEVPAAVVLPYEVREVSKILKETKHDYNLVQEDQLRLLCCYLTTYLVLVCFVTVETR